MKVKLKNTLNLLYKPADSLVDHDGIEHAGYLAFILLLAFFPFLVFFVAILGALGETDMGAQFIRMILDNAPQDILAAIIPRINEILSGPPTGLLTISILGTIWTSSSMIEGYRGILNRAYRVATPPSYYMRRALSIMQLLILVAILVVSMFVLLLVPIFASKIYGLFDSANAASQMTGGQIIFQYSQISFLGVEWGNIRYLIIILVMFLFISALFYWLPNVKQSWPRTFPGAIVAVLGWMVAGRAFSYYLENFSQMNLVYGSLGGMIAFLLFFYVINIIFIYGAEFNYLLEKSMGIKFEEKHEVKPRKRRKMSNTPKASNPMWGGHYKTAPDELLQEINASISFDQKMYKEDIEASIAHARMLMTEGIISKEDCNNIVDGLMRIRRDADEGLVKFNTQLEDIHMNIESRLKGLAGESAGRLHTARSRNDQVATDFKLWCRNKIDALLVDISNLQKILVIRAGENIATIMPGFTHLQSAQPVTFGHHLMAYYEMLKRDAGRLLDCRARLNECPLGAAALAGTPYPINRVKTAEELGFDRPTANSLDSVSDRDFALEFLSAASITMMHLSRLAEELIVWSSKQFDFIKLSEKFTTGSSIMPQKRNPDAAELVRGKTGRVYGSLMGLLTVMKALPLAYNKDSQEDKEPVFDAAETLDICLKVTAGMIADLTVNKEKMLESVSHGFPTATDFADWLVRKLNVPFRDAHHITGKAVRIAEEKNCKLEDISFGELQALHGGITMDIYNVLTVEASVKSRTSYGGTAPDNVLAQVNKAKQELKLNG